MTIGALGVYLFEVSLFLMVLYLFNNLLLGDSTLHRFNRAVWLVSIVISFLLPLAIGDYSLGGEVDGSVAVGAIQAAIEGGGAEVVEGLSVEMVVKGLFWCYVVGVALFLIYNISIYISLLLMVCRFSHRLDLSIDEGDRLLVEQFREYEKMLGVGSKVRYIILDDAYSPFSWFGYVALSRADFDGRCREIVIHELSHVEQRHSWDILFVNIVNILLWFNPASWLIKRSLQQVHEYCADESVLASGANAREYQLLLIKKAVGTRLHSMSNSLNHSNLKKRITMMLKTKTESVAGAKCLYAIPLLLLLVALLSTPLVAQRLDEVSNVKGTNNSETTATPTEENDEPFLFVEVMPQFEGGTIADFRRWFMSNMRYPAEMHASGTSGRVVVSFIVERDGSLSTFTILASPHEAFSNEVIRLLKSSPKWTPGMQRGEKVRLKFTLPVEFSITQEETEPKQ